MDIKEISVFPKGLTGDYLQGDEDALSCFDYSMQDKVYDTRIRDLQSRSFERQELVRHLRMYNEGYGASAKTIENILALEDSRTVVVIAGQQAGILTGPLYTIHKIISIIQLAKEQEKKLGVRVVPVFWIAGEDHDIDEINHVHILKNQTVKKSILHGDTKQKVSASETELNQEDCQAWIRSVFRSYQETSFTTDMMQFVTECLERSVTYTDFFAFMITELFKEEGLILVDSGNPELRKIEAPFFETILKHEPGIREALSTQQQKIIGYTYTPLITTKQNAIHLFLKIDGERWLLEREEDVYVCKEGKVRLTEEELVQIIYTEPERVSNNVVTRPLMQEYLFPTLAFIGGPGEVAYWAELQLVFHEIGWKVPPVVPRQMISYVERHIERDLKDLSLQIEDVFTKQLGDIKDTWLRSQVDEPLDELFEQARLEFEMSHRHLREAALRVNPSFLSFAEKNKRKIEEQLQLFERALQKDIHTKHEVELAKFRRIEVSLQPHGLLQERIWNILYYLNRYGFSFVQDVVDAPFSWNGKHKIVNL